MIDVWRLADIAKRLRPSNPLAEKQAILSELAHTLGVAATLTFGNLPVYVIESEHARIAA